MSLPNCKQAIIVFNLIGKKFFFVIQLSNITGYSELAGMTIRIYSIHFFMLILELKLLFSLHEIIFHQQTNQFGLMYCYCYL